MYVREESIEGWRETVESFMREEIGIEYCRRKYRNEEYPEELYDALLDRGWFALTIPEAFGGRGGTQLEQAVLLEAVGKYGYDFGLPVVTSTTVAENVLEFGTDEQRERFLPKLLDGEMRFSIGVTEPETGSNAAGLQTEAIREDGRYVVNGEKTYQSGAAAPDTVVGAYVRTDPDASKREGVSSLLIPNDADGVEVTELPLVARKAVGTAEISFEDAAVPVENRIGDEGEGWAVLSDHLIREHVGMAALMVGNARTAVEMAADEAADRERFGQPIGHFQAIGHRLADMRTEVDAARMLVYRAAAAIDRGEGSRRLTAQAKLKAGEVLQSVTRDGVQILGGEGLVEGNDMGRYWREGASSTIAGGTSEIQRSVISREMLSGRGSGDDGETPD
jgi:alkylation response protein AidB-like acyl-CoA dehydrogenase